MESALLHPTSSSLSAPHSDFKPSDPGPPEPEPDIQDIVEAEDSVELIAVEV